MYYAQLYRAQHIATCDTLSKHIATQIHTIKICRIDAMDFCENIAVFAIAIWIATAHISPIIAIIWGEPNVTEQKKNYQVPSLAAHENASFQRQITPNSTLKPVSITANIEIESIWMSADLAVITSLPICWKLPSHTMEKRQNYAKTSHTIVRFPYCRSSWLSTSHNTCTDSCASHTTTM